MWHTREVDAELDLNGASRETLLEIIDQQRAVIAELQRRIGALESRLNGRGPTGMPGNKPSSGRQPPEKKEPRKPRRHGFARKRMTPTRRVEHALEVCPDCGTHLVSRISALHALCVLHAREGRRPPVAKDGIDPFGKSAGESSTQ